MSVNIKDLYEKKVKLSKGAEVTVTPLSLSDLIQIMMNHSSDLLKLEDVLNQAVDNPSINDNDVLVKVITNAPTLLKSIIKMVVVESSQLPAKLPLQDEVSILTEAFKLTFGSIEEVKKFVKSAETILSTSAQEIRSSL